MQHHVYFWFKEANQNDTDRAAFEKGLEDLLKISHIQSGGWGKPADTPERPVTDKSFDYGIYLTFESIEAHNAYQVDTAHDLFVERFKDFWKDAKVLDVS